MTNLKEKIKTEWDKYCTCTKKELEPKENKFGFKPFSNGNGCIKLFKFSVFNQGYDESLTNFKNLIHALHMTKNRFSYVKWFIENDFSKKSKYRENSFLQVDIYAIMDLRKSIYFNEYLREFGIPLKVSAHSTFTSFEECLDSLTPDQLETDDFLLKFVEAEKVTDNYDPNKKEEPKNEHDSLPF